MTSDDIDINEIRDLERSSKDLHKFAGLEDLITGREISMLVNRAEALGLVNREGMKGGLRFACHEKELTDQYIHRSVSMPVLRHVFNEAHRAVMIMTRNEGRYQPRAYRPYGKIYAPRDWNPLFP